MEKLRIDNLSNGLFLSGPATRIPEGTLRRYRGGHPLSNGSVISRDGSELIHAIGSAVHSAAYFNSKWYLGAGTVLYEETDSLITGLSGDRLTFALMPPTADLGNDYLFFAGGDILYKIDNEGNYSNWGISPPQSICTLTDGGAGGSLVDGGTYAYQTTFLNSSTGTRSNSIIASGVAIDSTFKLLLHCNGVNRSTVFEDSGDTGHTVTSNGTYAYVSIDDSKFGGASVYIDVGSGSCLSIPDHVDWNFAGGDFTIDFWMCAVYYSALIKTIISQYEDSDNWMWCYTEGDVGSYPDPPTLYFRVKSSGSEIITLSAQLPSGYTNNWIHVAIVRETNTFALYFNGVSVDSNTFAVTYPDISGQLLIGAEEITVPGSPGYSFTGYLDEFRILKGAAGWSEDFNPPQAPWGTNTITLAGGSTSVDLTNIPESEDNQVDVVELWRTVDGGSIYFKLIGLANGTTTYTDNIADADLLNLELPTDNAVPYAHFDDCLGPWNGSMFWISREEEGERGRVYYSPIGRAEAMQGFINVTSDSEGLQKLFSYAGNLYVLSRSRLFQIYGTNPYYYRELPGVPGTTAPHTLSITSIGPAWESQSGVYVFLAGSQAQLLSYDAVKPIFRGRAIENLAAFTGVVATFARGEYIISNGSNTLAFNVETKVWRDLGLGCTCLAYDPSNDIIAAGVSTNLLDFEKEGETDDNSSAILFDIKTGEISFDPPGIIELIRIEANANGETLTLTPAADNSAVASYGGTLETDASRVWSEFAVPAQIANRLSLQISGSLDAAVEIFAMEIVYSPCVLYLVVGETTRAIPGRLDHDLQTLTFEDFSSDYLSQDLSMIVERLFYDFFTNDEDFDVTLTVLQYNAGTADIMSSVTINNSTRDIDFINIKKKGRFQKLVISGDFTAGVSLRRLELHCTARAPK